MKDAYYFPHDCNARHDPKVVALCMRWKNLGYAAYFITIEMLREQNNYMLQAKLKPCLQLAWGTYENLDFSHFQELFNDMIKFGLLEENEDFIFSPSLLKRMEAIDNRRDRLREAGRKGGLSQAKAKLKPRLSNPQAGKESKVKESKDIANAPAGPTKQFIDHWFQLYRAKFNKPYHVQGGKDGSLVKRLLETFELETLKKLAVKFFESEDKFIINSGYGLNVFPSQVNKLSIDLEQEEEPLVSALPFDQKD